MNRRGTSNGDQVRRFQGVRVLGALLLNQPHQGLSLQNATRPQRLDVFAATQKFATSKDRGDGLMLGLVNNVLVNVRAVGVHVHIDNMDCHPHLVRQQVKDVAAKGAMGFTNHRNRVFLQKGINLFAHAASAVGVEISDFLNASRTAARIIIGREFNLHEADLVIFRHGAAYFLSFSTKNEERESERAKVLPQGEDLMRKCVNFFRDRGVTFFPLSCSHVETLRMQHSVLGFFSFSPDYSVPGKLWNGPSTILRWAGA
jgi:hypothetical protein